MRTGHPCFRICCELINDKTKMKEAAFINLRHHVCNVEVIFLSERNSWDGTAAHQPHASECFRHLSRIRAVQRFHLVRREGELDDHAPNSHRNSRRKGEAYLL